MDKVVADRVPPVHIAPLPAIRIVLKVKMPLSILVHHAIGVIVPPQFL